MSGPGPVHRRRWVALLCDSETLWAVDAYDRNGNPVDIESAETIDLVFETETVRVGPAMYAEIEHELTRVARDNG